MTSSEMGKFGGSGSGRRRFAQAVKLVAGIVGIAAAVVGGPKLFSDAHETLCGWGGNWRGVAEPFAACPAQARQAYDGPSLSQTVALQQLHGAGWNPTGAGHVGAVAFGSRHVEAFETLGITGSEADFRKGLLREYRPKNISNLLKHIYDNTPGRFTSAMVGEIDTFVGRLIKSRSLDAAWQASCGTGEPMQLGEQFAKARLHLYCGDRQSWEAEAREILAILSFSNPDVAGLRLSRP